MMGVARRATESAAVGLAAVTETVGAAGVDGVMRFYLKSVQSDATMAVQ